MCCVTDTEVHSTIIISEIFASLCSKGPRVKPSSLHQGASLADHQSSSLLSAYIQVKTLSSSGVEARLTLVAGAAMEGPVECFTAQSQYNATRSYAISSSASSQFPPTALPYCPKFSCETNSVVPCGMQISSSGGAGKSLRE